MQKSNVEILHHFYGLLMEMDFHEPDEFLTECATQQKDVFIQKHMRLIKLQTTKYKALMQKNVFDSILIEFQKLKEIGLDKIKKSLTQQEAMQLQPLFNRFEELSSNDKNSIAEDKELLQLLSSLKRKLKDEQSND